MKEIVQAYLFELILVSLVLYALVATHISMATKKSWVERSVADAIAESKRQILESISPRVVFCASIDQVKSEAAEIILAAVKEYSAAVDENEKLKDNGDSRQFDISQYFVTIYGAASLSTEDDGTKQQSNKPYDKARQQASKSKLRFRRYVSLLDSSELSSRSEPIQTEYIGWLKRQKSDLDRDANYAMIVSPRAPRWGSSNTSIIGNTGIIEIKGHGGSAFAIYDRRIATDLRASLRADIYGGLLQNIREISSGDKASMSWLAAFIRDCEGEIERKIEPANRPRKKGG